MHNRIILVIALMLLITNISILSQNNNAQPSPEDLKNELLQDAKVEAARKEIEITVRNVEITKFPEIKIIIEAYNRLGEPLDSLSAESLFVYENGVPKKVLKVQKIPVADKVAVDFVFLMDITGSMQQNINQIRSNVQNFTNQLNKRGIDYRLGLILFADDVTRTFQPTSSVYEFMNWLSTVKAFGGNDEKENALEALNEAASNIKYRDEANRVAVIVTDAPYHQRGENGNGTTNWTTESITEKLIKKEVRLFSIVPPKLTNYQNISRKTRGNYFDIDFPFSTILDNFSSQLTNLYILTYRSDEEVIPDSIEISLFNKDNTRLVKKTIPIVELGRKLIIENLLFPTNKFDLPPNVDELNIMAEFMKSKPNITIMIEGHTDAIGSEAKNDQLSLLRADAVKNYLVSRGIREDRIKTKGYGKKRPIANNKDEFGRQLNRRTEIIIVSK